MGFRRNCIPNTSHLLIDRDLKKNIVCKFSTVPIQFIELQCIFNLWNLTDQ